MPTFTHRPVLGTLLEIRVSADSDAEAHAVDEAIVAEIDRLEDVFSVYRPGSELERGKRGEVAEPSTDLQAAVSIALGWHRRSGGAFHVATRSMTDLWRGAEQLGRPPSATELAAVAGAPSPIDVDEQGRIRITGDASGIDLNAFVKGWIVDRAVERAIADRPHVELTVSAGGDVRHIGSTAITIGIENPLRPYDNEPPVAYVALGSGGLATSGRARRGVEIAGIWYSHVIDPRTARPVDHVSGISVVAGDAATADVIATIAGIEPPDAALERADDAAAACLVILPTGEQRANDRWRSIERQRP